MKEIELTAVETVRTSSQETTSSEQSDPLIKHLRAYDKGNTTRRNVLIALATILLGDLVSFAITVSLFARTSSRQTLDGHFNAPPDPPGSPDFFTTGILYVDIPATSSTSTILPLILAFVITSCQEVIALVHTFSLKEALRSENRLYFNSNLRLLQHCTSSKPNSWYCNALYGLSVAVAYAAASRVFLFMFPGTLVSGVGLAALTIGIFGQSVISLWSYAGAGHKALTWSSNPINNGLALLHTDLVRYDGRCMLPYSASSHTLKGSAPQKPTGQQPALAHSRPSIKLTLSCAWLTFVLTLIWALVVEIRPSDIGSRGTSNILQEGPSFFFPILMINQQYSSSPWMEELVVFLFVLGVQLYLTFTLHCAEVVVNAARDEQSWRQATRENGMRFDTNAIKAALTSWMTVALFIFKTGIHWAFGNAISVRSNFGEVNDGTKIDSANILIWSKGLFIFAGLVLMLAAFLTFLAFRRPKGPQPSAHGHYQSLVDLIDDWGGEGDALFWGDKPCQTSQTGLLREFRHAGTVTDRKALGAIDLAAEYI